ESKPSRKQDLRLQLCQQPFRHGKEPQVILSGTTRIAFRDAGGYRDSSPPHLGHEAKPFMRRKTVRHRVDHLRKSHCLIPHPQITEIRRHSNLLPSWHSPLPSFPSFPIRKLGTAHTASARSHARPQ